MISMKARGDRPRTANPGTARLRRTPRRDAVFDRKARCSGRWGRRSREPTANGLEHALDLDESDRHVEVYSDGATTQRADTLDRNPDRPVNGYDETAREKGLIGGAWGYCANSSGTDDALTISALI